MRPAEQRIADVCTRLESDHNVWLATASAAGVPHLVPLSLAWDGTHILVATPTDSPTVRNAVTSPAVKANLDDADDVVLIAGSAAVVDFAAADRTMVTAYVDRVGWNPAEQGGDWSLLIITPQTVRAWRGVAEIQGRTIMRKGEWVAG